MIGTKYAKVLVFLILNLLVALLIFSSNTSFIFREGAYTATTVPVKELLEDGAIGVFQEKQNDERVTKVIDKNVATPSSVQVIEFSEAKLDNIVEADVLRGELELALQDESEIDLTGFFDKKSTPPVLYQPSGRRLLTQSGFSNLMKGRQLHLQRHCTNIVTDLRKNPRQHGLELVHPNVFYVLESESLAWCPVYKAASTNWMHNLLYLAGLPDDEIAEVKANHPRQPNDQGRIVAPAVGKIKLQSMEEDPEAKRLLIVRHPFDRLVSAFRDKLERCHGTENCTLKENWYYKTYGRQIVRSYRKYSNQKYPSDFWSPKNNYGAPLPVEKTWRSVELPTWWEFIRFILDNPASSYDEHWRPVHLYCSICSYSFNYILHFENIKQEGRIFADEFRNGNRIQDKWENRNDEGLSKEEIVGKYFSLLSDQEILDLYEKYKQDFKAFGYQFQFRGLKLNM